MPVVPRIRNTLFKSFILILPFYGVVFVEQTAHTIRLGYPSKLHTSHSIHPELQKWTQPEIHRGPLKPSYYWATLPKPLRSAL